MNQWVNKLQNSFDSDRFSLVFRYIIIFVILLSVLYILTRTFSRYTTDVSVQVEPKLAFFIADVGTYSETLELGEILPREEPYYYSFTVSNFKNEDKANVDLEYQLQVITTTNLPLQYELFRNTDDYTTGNIIDVKEVDTNADGMYFQTLGSSNYYDLTYHNKVTDTYVLKVTFPIEYQQFPEKYAGPVELIEVQLNARQKV